LIPIGGNEDKGSIESEIYTLDFVEDGILAHVLKESGGKDASIVIIPTASRIPHEVGENYLKAFDRLGCRNVKVLNIIKKEQAESREFFKYVEQANCVMFSGGDQSRIIRSIGGSQVHRILVERFENEKFVIAGTSAGAMCMPKEMIAGGSSRDSLLKGAVKLKKGMGFIHNVMIDSHFIRRGRFGRLAEAVAAFPNLLGVGLAEDTGLVVRNCNEFKVIGSGMIVLFDGRELTHNTHKLLKKGTPMSMSNLTVHVLSNGDRFNISERKIKILPIEEPFV